ncbi:hypothetical protein PIB30_051730 [Stylosanthes scabra]|uniref:Uncharacterized protein n=1 Tax=Stylosanthes scabra TaxID=79078 RepID=A0ABU6SJ01_9FABA|nr:hypothetical protein [Stylosanthes scabra]
MTKQLKQVVILTHIHLSPYTPPSFTTSHLHRSPSSVPLFPFLQASSASPSTSQSLSRGSVSPLPQPLLPSLCLSLCSALCPRCFHRRLSLCHIPRSIYPLPQKFCFDFLGCVRIGYDPRIRETLAVSKHTSSESQIQKSRLFLHKTSPAISHTHHLLYLPTVLAWRSHPPVVPYHRVASRLPTRRSLFLDTTKTRNCLTPPGACLILLGPNRLRFLIAAPSSSRIAESVVFSACRRRQVSPPPCASSRRPSAPVVTVAISRFCSVPSSTDELYKARGLNI